MDPRLILIFILLFIPTVYFTHKYTYNKFVIGRDMKKELDVLMEKVFKQRNMEDWSVSEYAGFNMETLTNGTKEFTLQVFIANKANHSWNPVLNQVHITGKIYMDDSVEVTEFKEQHSEDYGLLRLGENTSNINTLSAGVPNKIREHMTGGKGEPLAKATDGTPYCRPGTVSSIMCKEDETNVDYVTNQIMKQPAKSLKKEYGNTENETTLYTNNKSSQLSCSNNIPDIRSFEPNNVEGVFTCKQLYEMDNNPNALSLKNYKGISEELFF